jgi:hypothetical protein
MQWAPSKPWCLATHPADADRIVAFSLFGEVYVSEDAGTSWRKIAREFGEIRAAVGGRTDFFDLDQNDDMVPLGDGPVQRSSPDKICCQE